MIDQQQLNEIYAKKLMETGSHDAAMLKVCWVAYQQGLTDANKVTHDNRPSL